MPDPFGLFDTESAAGYLGISKGLLAKLRRQGKVGYVKLGGTVRYRLKDLDDFCDSCASKGPVKKGPRRAPTL